MFGMSTSGASCKRTIVPCRSALDTPPSCLCTLDVRIMVEQQRHMTEIHEQVRKHLQSSAEMQQRGQIQGGLKIREFKIGEQVWWYFPPTANQKLKYPWTFQGHGCGQRWEYRAYQRIRTRFLGPCLIIETSHKNTRWQVIVNPK